MRMDSSNPSELCCDDVQHFNVTGEECCASQLNDPSIRTCQKVGGTAISVPNQFAESTFCSPGSYDPLQSTCCQGVLHPTLGDCCDFDIITSPNDQTCCGGTIHKRDDSKICCAGYMYSSKQYTCCGNQPLHKLTDGGACCLDKIYSTYEQKCINGTLQTLLEDTTTSTTTQPAVTLGRVSSITKAPVSSATISPAVSPTGHYTVAADLTCGNISYDSRISACCSGRVYSIFKQKCEDGRVLRNSKCS